MKYPTIFNSSDIAIVTKIDLAEACEFDRQECYKNIHAVRPHIPILEISAKKGVGFADRFAYLNELRHGNYLK